MVKRDSLSAYICALYSDYVLLVMDFTRTFKRFFPFAEIVNIFGIFATVIKFIFSVEKGEYHQLIVSSHDFLLNSKPFPKHMCI